MSGQSPLPLIMFSKFDSTEPQLSFGKWPSVCWAIYNPHNTRTESRPLLVCDNDTTFRLNPMGDGAELTTAVDEPRCRRGHDVDHNLGNGLARKTAHHGAER